MASLRRPAFPVVAAAAAQRKRLANLCVGPNASVSDAAALAWRLHHPVQFHGARNW